MGKDVHKNHKEVPEMGGIAVIFGSLFALLIYIALDTFYFSNSNSITLLLAALATILIATMIGMTDDMLGWRLGLKQREKLALTFLVPIPMMVVNAGTSVMKFPFLGLTELGLLYPLLFLPGGVVGATNGFNMLAGYNGLEAGMGIIILSALGYLAWQVGAGNAVVIAVCLVAALIALLYYNRYPSRVFPGDVLTYPIGASIAVVAVLADLERFALMLFLPYYFELVLKARGRFRPDWTGEVLEDGSLNNREKWYSVPHVAISVLRRAKGKAYEYEVVAVILAFEVAVALLTIYTFRLPV
ncbi:MAG: glycosyltransferase 4 family protein, partial [Candidatus Hydrothermarchaeales archaeon]